MSGRMRRSALWPIVVREHGTELPHARLLEEMASRYGAQLRAHLDSPGEASLLAAYEMGKEMVRSRLSPEEAMMFHMRALRMVEDADAMESDRFLMEVMAAFGAAFRALHARVEADETLRRNYRKLKHALGDTLEAINSLQESKDVLAVAHQRRVAQLAVAIAERLGLDEDRLEGLRVAASLHDVGMMRVPPETLARPGKLAPEEIDLVRAHPQVSYDMLKDIDSPWPIAEIARQHHERLDGKGYPLGLAGEEILLESRIISVADTVEAMISQRPYRAALDIATALEEIRKGSGSRFDPRVVEICDRLFTRERFTFH